MTTDELLFVTTYNAELFAASGLRLTHSFLKLQPTGRLLAGYEGGHPFPTPTDSRLLFHNLEHSPLLTVWLKQNADVIPVHLGGTLKPCTCPGREERHAKHKKGCPGQWMNRNASRWFRKVITLGQAAHVGGYRYLVWLDADAYFVKPLTVPYVVEKLAGTGMAYFRGHRPAVEAGVMFFDLVAGGLAIIRAITDRYVSKAYRKDERWDDGYQWSVVLDTKRHSAIDLVHPTKHRGVTNNVIPTTDVAKYLVHDKGRHGTVLDIMK
jgi:hypothetical protein